MTPRRLVALLTAVAVLACSLCPPPVSATGLPIAGGRVKSITPSGTTTYLGESVEIALDGTTTNYLFAGSQRIAAMTTPSTQQTIASTPTHSPPSHSQSRWATWWRNVVSLVATWLDLPLTEAAGPPAALRFYHPDHLGSSHLVTDGTGAVIQQLEYTPYGSLSVNTGSLDVPHKFTGQRWDATNGLYFYHSRYYDPQLGRFLQPDTIVPSPGDPQALNRYSYARNNPVKFIDPTGHFFWFIPMLIGALLGGLLGGIFSAINGQSFSKGFLTGAVSGAILGGYGAIAGTMFSGASASAIIARATTMAGAGALAGTASAAISGGSLGQGAAFGGAFAGLGSLVPGPNIPFFGKGAVGGLLNPIANGALRGAVFGAGAAAMQDQGIGQGALTGAVLYAGGAATNAAIGHTVGFLGSGQKPILRDGVFFYEGKDLNGAITFGNVVYGPPGLSNPGNPAMQTFQQHELGHTKTYGLLGPFFLPAYLSQAPLVVALGPNNPFVFNIFEHYALGGAPTTFDVLKAYDLTPPEFKFWGQ